MSDVVQFLESRRSRLGRWAAAALIVCVLHAGGAALALMYWQEVEDADDPAGALTVEMAPLPAVVPVDSPDVAHGPEQQQARLTHEAAKPVVEEVTKDIPPVEPSPAPEPEVALPKPRPEEKEQPREKEEPDEPTRRDQTPQQDADVPLTTAPPKVEAQPAPRSAPSPGQSASVARVQASWQKAVVRQLERHSRGRYPAAAERRGVQGVVMVRFRVDRAGHVVSSGIAKSSGSPVLDEEALAILKRASPLPVPPDEISDPFLDNFMPIAFGIKPGG
jgi:periplasmic protein TonB